MATSFDFALRDFGWQHKPFTKEVLKHVESGKRILQLYVGDGTMLFWFAERTLVAFDVRGKLGDLDELMYDGRAPHNKVLLVSEQEPLYSVAYAFGKVTDGFPDWLSHAASVALAQAPVFVCAAMMPDSMMGREGLAEEVVAIAHCVHSQVRSFTYANMVVLVFDGPMEKPKRKKKKEKDGVDEKPEDGESLGAVPGQGEEDGSATPVLGVEREEGRVSGENV